MKNSRFFVMVLLMVVFNLMTFAASVVFYNVPIWAIVFDVAINAVMVYFMSNHTTDLDFKEENIKYTAD